MTKGRRPGVGFWALSAGAAILAHVSCLREPGDASDATEDRPGALGEGLSGSVGSAACLHCVSGQKAYECTRVCKGKVTCQCLSEVDGTFTFPEPDTIDIDETQVGCAYDAPGACAQACDAHTCEAIAAAAPSACTAACGGLVVGMTSIEWQTNESYVSGCDTCEAAAPDAGTVPLCKDDGDSCADSYECCAGSCDYAPYLSSCWKTDRLCGGVCPPKPDEPGPTDPGGCGLDGTSCDDPWQCCSGSCIDMASICPSYDGYNPQRTCSGGCL